MFNIKVLFSKVHRNISSQGLTSFLYKLSSYISYPKSGFSRYGVNHFMRRISLEITPGLILLDAGAGDQPYRELFKNVKYESCDYKPVLAEVKGAIDVPQTFYCDLEAVPKPENTYDVVICNQVLEHVKRPEKVVCELFRTLKPGGKLYLTTPQCAGIHMTPHNYFNFLSFGLKYLFEQAGFQIVFIEPLGGIFWVLGKVMQKSYESLFMRIPPSFRLLFFPCHVLIIMLIAMFSFVFLKLDKLDREKEWTLNYGCYCIKPLKGEIL